MKITKNIFGSLVVIILLCVSVVFAGDTGTAKDKFKQKIVNKTIKETKEKYKKEVVSSMMKEFSYKSIMQVPKITSIVLNVGMGEAIQDIKPLEAAVKELATITGQAPVITRAKKSIARSKAFHFLP